MEIAYYMSKPIPSKQCRILPTKLLPIVKYYYIRCTVSSKYRFTIAIIYNAVEENKEKSRTITYQ